MKNLKQTIGGIIITILIFSMSSCRIARDRKAVARVIYDSSLFNQVGRQWAVSNPCPPGSVTYIPGQTVTVVDSSAQDAVDSMAVELDSLLSVRCPTLNVDSLIKAVKASCRPVTVYKTKTDTLLVPDNRAINLVQGDLDRANGQITQLKTDNASEKKTASNRLWWLIGACVLIVLLTYLLIKK